MTMSVVKIALVGATGHTGASFLDGLLAPSNVTYQVTALSRPQSAKKAEWENLKGRGVKVVPVDLQGPHEAIVQALQGVDVVLSSLVFTAIDDEIPLANAAKEAGVKRFLQSAFMVVIPPRGVVDLREKKEDIFNHVQKIGLPYTYVDAGYWYQLVLPRLPSGKTDYALPSAFSGNFIFGDGNKPMALADLRDIGRYAARVIADPRTINKRVHVYSEVLTQNQIYETVERISGEMVERTKVSEEQILTNIEDAKNHLKVEPSNGNSINALVHNQLSFSFGIRGDNNPEYSMYLGYLDGKDLYPDFKYKTFEEFLQEALDGKIRGAYRLQD